MINPKKALLKNVFSNWATMAINICIAFFMSPFLVHNLGKEVYGIWALVLSVVSYSSFLDAGMRQALSKYLPKYFAVRDFKSLNQILSSSNAIYLITGSIVLIATLIVAFFFVDSFNISSDLMPVMRVVLLIIGFNQALRFFFITASALGPFHRYDLGNMIDASISILNASAIFLFIGLGYRIYTLAIITVTSSICKYVLRTYYQKKVVPQIEYKFKHVRKARVKELLNYGIISYLIVIAWIVIFNSDNLIIGLMSNASDITYYSIAGMMIVHLRALINAIGVPLVPAISHLDATRDFSEISDLFNKLSNYLYYLCAGICITILFFGDDFIYLWMGPDFTVTVKILNVLIISACFFLPQITVNSVLLGISKHKILLYILAVEAMGKIILSILLFKKLGIIGVAWGTAIPQLAIYTVVYPIVFHKVIKSRVSIFYKKSITAIFYAICFVLPSCYFSQLIIQMSGWAGLVVKVFIPTAMMLIGFLFLVLEKDDRMRLLEKIPSFGLN